MSEDARLKRLGLLHLKDKPEELSRELERRRQEFDRRADDWEEERRRRRSVSANAGEDEPARSYATWTNEQVQRRLAELESGREPAKSQAAAAEIAALRAELLRRKEPPAR
ncbi:MAG: hypothetical protein ACRD3V_03010 [Vicinamibacteria bacterium]